MEHHDMDMGMQMSFYNTYKIGAVLFDWWKVETVEAYIATLVVVFLFSFGAVWLNALARSYSAERFAGSKIDQAPLLSGSMLLESVRSGKSGRTVRLKAAALHTTSLACHYLLMLLAMTYNVGVFFTIIAGCGLGFFVFFTDSALTPDERCCT